MFMKVYINLAFVGNNKRVEHTTLGHNFTTKLEKRHVAGKGNIIQWVYKFS